MTAEFDNLRTLHAATTAGEWSVSAGEHPRDASILDERENALIHAGDYASSEATLLPTDAAFIVAAHNELPALLARLDEVTAERDALAVANETARNLLVASFQTAWGESAPLGKQLSHEAVEVLSAVAIASVLAAHDAKVRAEALREAANDYRSGQLTGIFMGRDDYAKEWLRARADKEENR